MLVETNVVALMQEVAGSLRAHPERDGTLETITRLATEKLPNVDDASISLSYPNGEMRTLAPSSDAVVKADAVQYELDEGPCVDAVKSGLTVRTPRVGSDERWPHYGPQAESLGIAGQMAVHLYATRSSNAALNLYSATDGAFDESTHIAELFASHAAVALGFARSVETLKEALDTRNAIGIAVGMTMERYGLDEERAFSFLVRVSQTGNVKLRLVAEELIRQVGQEGP